MNNKLLSMLGICNKAGKLVMGKDKTIEAIKKNKARLVILASDLSIKTSKDIINEAKENDVKIENSNVSMNEISHVFSRVSGIICILDNGFAKKIETLLH